MNLCSQDQKFPSEFNKNLNYFPKARVFLQINERDSIECEISINCCQLHFIEIKNHSSFKSLADSTSEKSFTILFASIRNISQNIRNSTFSKTSFIADSILITLSSNESNILLKFPF